jgi:hypothetical protein
VDETVQEPLEDSSGTARTLDGQLSHRSGIAHAMAAILVENPFYLVPVAGQLSELALGAAGGHARVVLRPRPQPGRQHPCGHGDPYFGGHHVAGLFRGIASVSS